MTILLRMSEVRSEHQFGCEAREATRRDNATDLPDKGASRCAAYRSLERPARRMSGVNSVSKGPLAPG
jgi:hypothetical protein